MRSNVAAIWGARETGGFAVDPSASGALYRHIPHEGQVFIKDNKTPIPTDYGHGENEPTVPLEGPDAWSLTFRTPLPGLAVAAGDGVAPGADDYVDDLVQSFLSAPVLVSGEGLAAGSAAGTLVLDTDAVDIQDVVPVYEANLPSAYEARTQWAKILTDGGGGNYTIAPNWEANPTTAAIAYGHKIFRPVRFTHNGGDSIAFHVQEGSSLFSTLLGGKPSAAKIVCPRGKKIMLELTYIGDRKVVETKASLPAALPLSRACPVGLLSPVWFNGAQTNLDTDEITIDFMPQASERETTARRNGRSTIDILSLRPKVIVKPTFTQAAQNWVRGVTTGRLFVQLGGGVLGGGILNTWAFDSEVVHVEDGNGSDKGGRRRQSLTFIADAPGIFSGTTRAHFFQLIRA